MQREIDRLKEKEKELEEYRKKSYDIISEISQNVWDIKHKISKLPGKSNIEKFAIIAVHYKNINVTDKCSFRTWVTKKNKGIRY